MSKFKAGDKVYYPSSCGIVFTVEDSKNVLYPLMLDQTCIKESGLYSTQPKKTMLHCQPYSQK